MKKITLITTVILTTALTGMCSKIYADNISGLDSKSIAVNVLPGKAIFSFGDVPGNLEFDFAYIDFDQSASAKILSTELTLPSSTLTNYSFSEKRVQIDVTATGKGLSVDYNNPIILDALQAQQKSVPTGSKAIVYLDPVQYDATNHNDYQITISATDVSLQNPN